MLCCCTLSHYCLFYGVSYFKFLVILFYFILFYLISSYLILSYLILSHLILSYLILSYPMFFDLNYFFIYRYSPFTVTGTSSKGSGIPGYSLICPTETPSFWVKNVFYFFFLSHFYFYFYFIIKSLLSITIPIFILLSFLPLYLFSLS